jgi:acetolactate synthase regulatory subunit
MNLHASIKHTQINKANNMMNIVIAFAAVVITFSLISTKALLSQSSYQHKALGEKNKAVKQLQENVTAANSLKTQYDVFEQANPNMIGGKGGEDPGDGPKDGDNARIVLDALPSSYDFPALISSLEKIFDNANVDIQNISGTDQGDAVNDTNANADPTTTAAIPISISANLKTTYENSLNLIKDFERSIRPFNIKTINITGSAKEVNLDIQVDTYYQPGVSLQIQQKDLK